MAIATANNLKFNMELIDKKDVRMRFRNSRDPIYVAFDFIEKQSLKVLALDFVKGIVEDTVNFISFKK